MWREFKEFAIKGNVIDMAVGIIIGAAFGTIAKSLVSDIVMPPIGLLLGKVDFANLYFNISGQTYGSLAEAKEAGAAVITYGAFINNVISFVVVSMAVFLVVKAINQLKREKEEEAPPDSKDCPHCCSSIPIAATRCPQCTSELEAVVGEG